jgi:hypothetical protein
MIVTVFDSVEQRTRRFVRLGGKMRHWKGPAIKHGKDAKANLKKAAEKRLRVVGFEAEADATALQNGERKVAHFFLDRAHELKRIFEVSGGDVIERLELNQRFEGLRYGRPVHIIDPGDLFELVPPRGEMPGRLTALVEPDETASLSSEFPSVDGTPPLSIELDDSGGDEGDDGLFGETADEKLGRPLADPASNESADQKNGGWGGGESPQHKALKMFVVENPTVVGADDSWVAMDEYALRSGDSIDVFFKREDAWIAVEVKSAVSDGSVDDYERGLYQVVKYRAVLEAQAKVDRPGAMPTLRVLLLLENQLPRHLCDTARQLGVEVLENVKPLSSCKTR